MQIVVFESFRCPGCRTFAGTAARLREKFRDRLRVVYKHYPLSTDCNDRLTRDMQPGACDVAFATQAAHRQSRFWPFHDALFAARSDALEDAIDEATRQSKLDRRRFEADRESEWTRRRVAEDIALGNRLMIPGTPAVFLDGRLVGSASGEVLEILIRHELHAPATATAPVNGVSNWAGLRP